MKSLLRTAWHLLRPPVIQFSPPRTGSTLLWNALLLCLPTKKILKQHEISRFQKSRWNRSPIVCSVRNPLDSIASVIQAHGQTPSDEVIREKTDIIAPAFRDVRDLLQQPRVKVLKYEDFAHDFPFLFREIEEFFGIAISEETRQAVRDKCSLSSVKAKAEQLGDFDNYDEEDHIHGRHVSDYEGASGYYSEFFTAEQMEKMYAELGDIFDAFGYDAP